MARPGRTPDPADIAARKAEFDDLKARLNANALEIATIAGISVHSVRRYQGPRARYAPTRNTLDAMRREILRRLESREEAAKAAARKAWLERLDFEEELRA